MATILWYHDFFDGPQNGMALYKGESVWFRRIDQTTEIKEPHKFDLLELDLETIELLNKEHEVYCQMSGRPLKYGDPFIYKPPDVKIRHDFPKYVDQAKDGYSGKMQVMFKPQIYSYNKFNPNTVGGRVITQINEFDFDNYQVAHESKRI